MLEKNNSNFHINYGSGEQVGSGIPNVIKEIRYIKNNNKVDRLHFKFLSKKRGFLIRQINLAKKLYTIE